MTDQEIIEKLQAEGGSLNAVEMANLLEELLGGISQSAMTTYFKQSFPEIPLRKLIMAGAWSRLSGGRLSDDDIEKLLGSWLPRKSD